MPRKSGHAGLVKRKITVKKNGKTFERYQWVKVGEDEPEPKKDKKEIPKSKGSFNVGDSINFMGKDLKVEKVSEKEQTIKINGKVYTFDAIDKGSKEIKKPEASIKDLKAPKKKLEKEEGIEKTMKIQINKSELTKSIDLVYDKQNRKFEDSVVNDMTKWIKNSEMNLKNELKVFYEDLNY